ncbi:type I-C CRISPR-associated protein Cas8c/Csd1 [Rhodopirellula europaea]|jgi:CRISPR-associated protein Csd1|uniref:CRISPR-associated protein, Csd1 family n=1 Tax=Rhodopirellula europaea SH398 TaxID=1263868 RepID=M5SKB4_9BACT|nr:type I-C CRISPR-associated protein Cas8c/Csd1 [Rhodopirellula europaea]EMI28182.1 CRISPR-associated protein, Csd1 family [Rhodopirellula europaea SH398]
MILQRLSEYYDVIDADPEIEIAQEGFAPQKVTFEIVLSRDGSIAAINDLRSTEGKRKVPQSLRLPFEGRTSGVKAMFLWDKAEYLLGYLSPELRDVPDGESESDAKKRLKKIDRVSKCFEASKETHLGFADSIDNDDYAVLCQYYSNWERSKLTVDQQTLIDELGTGFGVFRIDGNRQRLHDSNQLRRFWSGHQMKRGGDEVSGTCLVTGDRTPLARLHGSIKGVRDAQSSGASIVSFNKPSFESFGKTQSFNSPVGEQAAFKYTTALNHLLDRKNNRTIQVGDATCVFWSEAKDTIAEDVFSFGLDPARFEDESRATEIGNVLSQAVDGNAVLPEPGAAFHVLGLSPNASRLSIRFWISGTVIEMVGRVAEHQRRLDIVRSGKDSDWIPLWMILAQTARESKEVPPLLGGALLRSVLTGGRYPEALLTTILRRIRAEQEIRHVKAAMIKAILNHNHQKEIPVMLDPVRPDPAYQLGRLFACLERAQEDALPGLNATIKDRYFGAASATPGTVFPRLIRMNQHHIGKLEGGKKVVAEKRIQEIMGRLHDFPSHLGITDQGLFSIGYYHQRQDFFTKKETTPENVQ